MKHEIAVIGGGMAGYEFANSLTRRSRNSGNLAVTVFERSNNSYPSDKRIVVTPEWQSRPEYDTTFGGRSRSWQGVFLRLDNRTLDLWPSNWQQELTRTDGAYDRAEHLLGAEFPELRRRNLTSPVARSLGLLSVPQAAKFYPISDDIYKQRVGADTQDTGRLDIYSPLSSYLSSLVTEAPTTVGKVERLTQEPNGKWTVHYTDADGNTLQRKGYSACILSATAIGNMQILAGTLETDLDTKITDHFSMGAILHLPQGGTPIDSFRHRRLWSGYRQEPDLSTNIFVQEMRGLPNGDRMVDICAVTEQGDTWNDYSPLSVSRRRNLQDVQIATHVSEKDRQRLAEVKQRLTNMAQEIAGDALDDTASEEKLLYETAVSQSKQQPANSFAWYEFPLGSFQHEGCTHPFGNNGPVTVSDDLEIAELPGVFVAGPGIFPKHGVANPGETIIATSRVLAAGIHERYQ